MSDNLDNDMLALACRNAMILKWLRELTRVNEEHPSILYGWVRTDYAKWMGMPDEEVVLDYITDAPSLDWFWANYPENIRSHEYKKY